MTDIAIKKVEARVQNIKYPKILPGYIVALAGCPIPPLVIATCLKNAGYYYRDEIPFGSQDIKNSLKVLEQQHLIESPAEGLSAVCPGTAATMVRLCREQGHFEAILTALDKIRDFGPTCRDDLSLLTRHLWRSCWETRKTAMFDDALERYSNRFGRLAATRKLVDWFLPFDAELVQIMDPRNCLRILDEIINYACAELLPIRGALTAALDLHTKKLSNDTNRVTLAHGLIWSGRLEEAEGVLRTAQGLQGEGLKGCLASLRGAAPEALTLFRKVQRNKPDQLLPIATLFYLIELLHSATQVGLDEGQRFLARFPNVLGISASKILATAFALKIRPGQEVVSFGPSRAPRFNAIETLIRAMYRVWFDAKGLIESDPRALFQLALENDYALIAREVARIMSLQDKQDTSSHLCDEESNGFLLKSRDNPGRYLVDSLWQEPEWEESLEKLIQLEPEARSIEGHGASEGQVTSRLTWHLMVLDDRLMIQPKEQRMTVKGEWSKPRPVALSRLAPGMRTAGYLTEQDHRVCDCIIDNSARTGGQGYSFDSDRAAVALIGHPLLFRDDAQASPVKLTKAAPFVKVTRVGEELLMEIVPRLVPDRMVQIQEETPSRIVVISFNKNHRQIAHYLSRTLSIPIENKNRVSQAIDNLSAMITVQSDLAGESTREIQPDLRIQVQLQPHGDGLKVVFWAQPLGENGPVFKPGTGSERVIAQIGGQMVQTVRDLPGEVAAAQNLNKLCTAIPLCLERNWDWVVDDIQKCLDLMNQLERLGSDLVISWPEGVRLSVTPAMDVGSMRVSIKKMGNWFGLDGSLILDDSNQIDFRRLLEMAAAHPGRFLPLGNQKFLALTEALRESLEQLAACTERSDEGLRIHPGAVLSLGDFTEGMKLESVDRSWEKHLEMLDPGAQKTLRTPSALKAELRPYQKEGFRWLARLSSWGFGACLADDMGLGKTLQALAIIVDRSVGGPTLVVTPASVTTNWVEETRRFAPGLNIHTLGDGDRKLLIESLGPRDLLVTSYGMFLQEEQLMTGLHWRTAVLDEAQAIKNPGTQRARAAMKLKADFRLILTGTPIENHLGELWSLFDFINPGLLGTLGKFTRRFMSPIEKYGNQRRRDTLKKLIQPFILRRLKSQVLRELPPKTEIPIHVHLSPEEWSLYRTLRDEALADLESSDGEANQYPRVLAQIMRLRRMCCHPRLILGKYPLLGGAKLNVFGPLLDDLLENNHKILVFSQFVDHLQVLREYLNEQAVAYQYLDGSTPLKQRTRAIEEFQAGVGDVFLISLKAGGTGLNLTAADYILHMDPWWNPAVEDQASDRAHRIGQDKPVTVYRFITQGTIEEKIVRLHQDKRDLADQLLEGQDMTGKMTTDALLKLIREG